MSAGDVSTVVMAGFMADGLCVAECLGTVATPAFQMQTGVGTTTPAQFDTGVETPISGADKAVPGSPSLAHTTGEADITVVGTVDFSDATPPISVTEQCLFGASGNAMTHHVFGVVTISSVDDSITFTEALTMEPVGP